MQVIDHDGKLRDASAVDPFIAFRSPPLIFFRATDGTVFTHLFTSPVTRAEAEAFARDVCLKWGCWCAEIVMADAK